MSKIKFWCGDILKYETDYQRLFICQCVNNMNVMGAGLALYIANKHPIVKELYHYYHKHYGLKVGDYHIVQVSKNKYIVNIVGQNGIGYGSIDYDGLRSGLRSFAVDPKEDDEIALPLIGAGLAGGDFNIIYKIIEEELKDLNVVIVYLEKDRDICEPIIM